MTMEDDFYMKCPFCGGELAWNSDFNASELYGGEYSDDDPAVCSYYTCRRCGRSYEICDPVQEERDGEYSDYWNSK